MSDSSAVVYIRANVEQAIASMRSLAAETSAARETRPAPESPRPTWRKPNSRPARPLSDSWLIPG